MSQSIINTNQKIIHRTNDIDDTFIGFSNSEVMLSGNIVPTADETYTLGNQNNYFEKIFVKEVQASNNSFTFGEEFKISKNGGEIGFLKVRNKNKLPPLITNFRDALLENGVYFLQKKKKVIKNNKATNKIVNFIKLLGSPDTYLNNARNDTPNKLIEILDAVVARNSDRFIISGTPLSSFTEVWNRFDGSGNADWNLSWESVTSETANLGRGKSESYTNNLDEIEFSLLTLQEIDMFITNDVQNAVNKKKLNNFETVDSTNLITFDSGFNSDYRFNMKGEIVGQFDVDENKFVTGVAVDIFDSGTNFEHNALDFTGYSQSTTYDAFAQQTVDFTSLRIVSQILDYREGERQFIIPVSSEYINSISERVDFLNNNPHLLALKKQSWQVPYAEEIPIVRVEDYSTEISNTLKITLKYSAHLENSVFLNMDENTVKADLYFDLRPEIVMGYDQSFTTSTETATYFEPLMNSVNITLSGDIRNEINDATHLNSSENFNNRVVFLPMHVAAMAGILRDSYLQLKYTDSDERVVSYTTNSQENNGIKIKHHVFKDGYNIVILEYNFYIDTLLDLPLDINTGMFEFKIISNDSYQTTTSTSTGAITGIATMEDYYDKTTNTQDPFMAGFSQKITTHITTNLTDSDFSNFIGSWNKEGDNVEVDTYRGNSMAGDDATGLTSLTSNPKILKNQVSAGQFDASELLAYNDEDYFIKYSMITKNKYASYTDDNFLIGFKDEPNSEPYCKLTVKGSIKNTKSIVVTDAKYNDSDFMNTMKNTLADGTVFTEGLIVSDRRSDVNNREVNGLYCRGDITTAGNFTADTIRAREIEAIEKLKIGTFEINNNGEASGSGLTLGGTLTSNLISGSSATITNNLSAGSLSTGSATITGAITANSANINGALGCASFTLSSDKRLKENIVDLKDETIDNIRPVKFNWKNGENKKDVLGIIAQEVDEVYPDVINKTGEFMKVDYIQFIPILIKEVQDLKKMNKILMAKIDLLEKN